MKQPDSSEQGDALRDCPAKQQPSLWPRKRSLIWAAVSLALGLSFALFAGANPALAQQLSIGFGDDLTITERSVQLVALITVLSLAPSILIMVTSFTRIVVVLSLLRSAIGLQTAPPNSVMVSLALFLTFFIMTPTFEEAYRTGVEPLGGRQHRGPRSL